MNTELKERYDKLSPMDKIYVNYEISKIFIEFYKKQMEEERVNESKDEVL